MLLLPALVAGAALLCCAQNPPPLPKDEGWKLAWSDEFNGPDGSGVDGSKWVLETGGEGWGNEELEYYTDRAANVFLRSSEHGPLAGYQSLSGKRWEEPANLSDFGLQGRSQRLPEKTAAF